MDQDLDCVIEDNESLIPNFNQYKYQHLNNYSGDEFINAFALEIIIRIVINNNLMTIDMIFENLDFTIENGKFIIGDSVEPYKDFKEEGKDPFISNFGFTSSYLANLFMMHPYFGGDKRNELIDFTYNFLGDNTINISIDLDSSEEELVAYIIEIKRDYEKKLDPLQKLHNNLQKEIYSILNTIPFNSINEKKQTIIKALFTYDYVKARNIEIDSYNNLDYEEDENKDNNLLKYPSINPLNTNCYFNEENFKLSGITPGTAKKLYYYLDPILTKYSIKTI